MSDTIKTRRLESLWLDCDVATIVELYDYEMTKKEEILKMNNNSSVHRPILNSDFQREFGWSLVSQRELVISVFIGYPILPIYIDRRDKRNYDYIVDGKQRVETLWRFVNNKFQIEYNGKANFFKDLPEEDQHRFLAAQIKMYVCKNWPRMDIADLFLKLQPKK